MCVMGVGELLEVSLKGIFSHSSPGFRFVKGSLECKGHGFQTQADVDGSWVHDRGQDT